MNLKNMKWPVVIITCILCVSLFWGVYYLRQKQFIEEPLSQALQELDEVEGVTLVAKEGNIEIYLEVQKLADLARFYETLEKTIASLYKGEYSLIIMDEPDAAIDAAYQKIHLALYEAMAMGNYVSMGNYIDEVQAQFDLEECRVMVTDDFVYLELENGDAYLYRRFLKELVKGEESL